MKEQMKSIFAPSSDVAVSEVRGGRSKQIVLVLAILLLTLVVSGAFFGTRAFLEGREIREYVGGPYGSQLLYLQGCELGASGGGPTNTSQTLEEQISFCRRTVTSRAGYYVYDFNIKRSVALSMEDMELWRKYAVLAFPGSLGEAVGNSETNEFNRIVPFEAFSGFEYDCVLDDNHSEASCKVATASCGFSGEAIRCTVFNPQSESTELHVIERDKELDLFVPHGFITGPDLFKLLKPRFFPSRDSM